MKISQENLKVLLGFVFLLLCSFVFEGCNDTINHINHIKNGNEFVESGDYESALSEYSIALSEETNSLEEKEEIIIKLEDLGKDLNGKDVETAEKVYRFILNIDEKDSKAIVGLIISLANSKDNSKIVEAYSMYVDNIHIDDFEELNVQKLREDFLEICEKNGDYDTLINCLKKEIEKTVGGEMVASVPFYFIDPKKDEQYKDYKELFDNKDNIEVSDFEKTLLSEYCNYYFLQYMQNKYGFNFLNYTIPTDHEKYGEMVKKQNDSMDKNNLVGLSEDELNEISKYLQFQYLDFIMQNTQVIGEYTYDDYGGDECGIEYDYNIIEKLNPGDHVRIAASKYYDDGEGTYYVPNSGFIYEKWYENKDYESVSYTFLEKNNDSMLLLLDYPLSVMSMHILAPKGIVCVENENEPFKSSVEETDTTKIVYSDCIHPGGWKWRLNPFNWVQGKGSHGITFVGHYTYNISGFNFYNGLDSDLDDIQETFTNYYYDSGAKFNIISYEQWEKYKDIISWTTVDSRYWMNHTQDDRYTISLGEWVLPTDNIQKISSDIREREVIIEKYKKERDIRGFVFENLVSSSEKNFKFESYYLDGIKIYDTETDNYKEFNEKDYEFTLLSARVIIELPLKQ